MINYKDFNDSLGHEAGDWVLRGIGSLLKENIRASDVACRYGGEEMTIILPDTSLADTCQKAKFLRKAIADLRVEYEGQILHALTASLGIACYPDHGETFRSLIQSADKALYCAKEAGRNQVMVAEAISPSSLPIANCNDPKSSHF